MVAHVELAFAGGFHDLVVPLDGELQAGVDALHDLAMAGRGMHERLLRRLDVGEVHDPGGALRRVALVAEALELLAGGAAGEHHAAHVGAE